MKQNEKPRKVQEKNHLDKSSLGGKRTCTARAQDNAAKEASPAFVPNQEAAAHSQDTQTVNDNSC